MFGLPGEEEEDLVSIGELTRKIAKEYYSYYNIIKRNAHILSTNHTIGALLPAATNYNFRRYYKKDFHF